MNHHPKLEMMVRLFMVFMFAISMGAPLNHAAVQAAPSAPDAVWTAYNDCSGTSSGNVTNYTITGSTTGLLRNYATGTNTPVTATFTMSGGPNLATSSGTETNSGTDAYTTFHNIANMVGMVNYGNTTGWYVDMTFTGLDPAKTYTFATSANRANSSYTTRESRFTISDITSATNASTSGVTVVSNESVAFSTGYNTVNGYVARWTGIQPGADGDFTVRTQAHTTVNEAYGPSVFMLQEEGDATAVTFQEGVSSYAGTVDTTIKYNSPTTLYGDATLLEWDTQETDGSATPEIAMLRFENIFGSGAGQIPAGASIVSASLRYRTGSGTNDYGDTANVYESQVTWDGASTYNTFGGEAGVQADEYANLVATATATAINTYYTIDVTASLQRWSAGTTNYGWLFLPNGSNSSNISSSEATTAAYRPLLTVVYRPPTVPTITTAGTLSAFSSAPGVPSAEQSYTVSGSNLTGDITITPPADFELSLASGSGFGAAPLALTPSGGSLPATAVYVRFNRATEGASSGNIAHTSPGAAARNVAVSGTATTPPTCYALSLSHTGQGSNPLASPANSTGCAAGQYIAGAAIALSGAAPASGWHIGGWTGTDNNSSTASTNTVTMPASAHAAGVTYAQNTFPVNEGATWKYLDNGTNQGTAWSGTAFDDSAWASGPAELGYGDGDEATLVDCGPNDPGCTSANYITTYFRHTFDVPDSSLFSGLNLRLLRDDGAVVYLNGVEIWRTNMPAGSVTYTTLASSAVGGTDETTFYSPAALLANTLVDGANVLAVEIHQSGAASSDISFDLELTGVPSGSTCYALTLAHTGNGTTPAASPANSTGCAAGQYLAGESISLSGAAPDTGWQIASWYGTSNNASTASTNSLTMPAGAHAAGVNYTATSGGKVCESFEAGWADGARIDNTNWFSNNAGPTVEQGEGVATTWGLSNSGTMFIWRTQAFRWSDPALTGVVAQLDFETGATAAQFDDDRVGWQTTNSDVNSNYAFGVQLDNASGHLRIEGYWDHVYGSGDDAGRPEIVNLDSAGLAANTWYRLIAEFTRLTATSAKIDVELWSLDAGGNQLSLVASGTLADTSTLGSTSPNASPAPEYFTAANLYPSYKNHTGQPANADNACYEPLVNQAPNAPLLASPLDGATAVPVPAPLSVDVTDPEGDELDVSFYGRKAGGVAGEDFTLIVIPDTQNEAQYYPAVMYNQFQWIANQKTARNIVFATSVGDIVNTSSSTEQWTVADTAYDYLDAGNVSYSVSPGNHDIGGLYETYFGVSRFSGKPWYAGHYGSDNLNNYSLFSASGNDFILINLQYSPTTANLDWADALLKANPNRRGIVVQHNILNTDNSWNSQTSYTALKDNPNLFLMLCGHMHTSTDGAAYRAELGDDGHTIHIMMADYQDYPNGGNGYLRILRFSPADDKIYATTYSPYIDASITSSPDQMEMVYDLADASAAFTLIGTVNNVPAGSSMLRGPQAPDALANLQWSGLEYLTQYEWYVTINDGLSTTTGPTWGFTSENNPTAVTLASFAATPRPGKIYLTWETMMETNLVGFNLYRSTSPEGERQQLNAAIIPGQAPGDMSGASYEFSVPVEPGQTYFYWLETVMVAEENAWFGPVEATLLWYAHFPLVKR